MTFKITEVDAGSQRFQRDFKRLDEDQRDRVIQALKDLLLPEIPAKYRLNKLQGYKRPSIYAIHITPNHSHKLTMEIKGTTAILRRVGTHREIDDLP